MLIRLLIAAVITIAGPIGMPTEYFESDAVTAPRVSEVETSASQRIYFQETGQYLQGELLEFWLEYGGVQVFGYPISGEVEQDGLTVQYFERSVLEIHPENPAEWRILLRRVGDQAAGPSWRRNGAFKATSPSSSGHFFEETQHSVAPRFAEYWHQFGGAKVFGFPISEEFSANGTILQYFERAVLQYQEDNPGDWQVVQPLLGREFAEYQGVDTSPKTHDGDVAVYHPHLWGQRGAGPGDQVVYLTFDDGPHGTWTPQVLDLLEEYDAAATFFVLGELAPYYPELIDRIVAEGHTAANHTYNHESMEGMPWSEFEWQIRQTEQALADAGSGSGCMRPPYGAMDSNTIPWAASLGYDVILWDIDTRDWELPGAQVIADRIISGVDPGDVVLLHDGGMDRSQTVDALEIVLQELIERGYQFQAMCQ